MSEKEKGQIDIQFLRRNEECTLKIEGQRTHTEFSTNKKIKKADKETSTL